MLLLFASYLSYFFTILITNLNVNKTEPKTKVTNFTFICTNIHISRYTSLLCSGRNGNTENNARANTTLIEGKS